MWFGFRFKVRKTKLIKNHLHFLGRTRAWHPKSVTIRRIEEPLITASEVGFISDLSTPLYKFNYDGKISLMENISLRSVETVSYDDQGLIMETSEDPDSAEKTFNERFAKYFMQHSLWLSCYFIRSDMFFTRSARLMTAVMTLSTSLTLNTVYLETIATDKPIDFGLMKLSLKALGLQLVTILVITLSQEIYAQCYTRIKPAEVTLVMGFTTLTTYIFLHKS